MREEDSHLPSSPLHLSPPEAALQCLKHHQLHLRNCQISCSDGTLSAEANKDCISAVQPIFFTSTFRMCFSADVQGHTTHTQKPAPGQTPAMSPCPSCPCRYQGRFYRIGCLIKEKTGFSKHPVNARKREEWKGNERNNLERRTEKQETLAPGGKLTTVLALPSSIEDVCFN